MATTQSWKRFEPYHYFHITTHHTTVISWLKAVGELLPDAYSPDQIPTVGELDELETFVHSKKLKSGCGRR